MSQVWQPHQSRKFQKWVTQQTRGGRTLTVYAINHINTRSTPWEDPELYSSYTFDWHSPITGAPMTGHLSAAGLCSGFGPIYDSPPPGLRHMADPAPQVAGPVDATQIHNLDEATIRGMEKYARDAARDRERHGFSRFH